VEAGAKQVLDQPELPEKTLSQKTNKTATTKYHFL
jgi:hypothetical protein